MTAGKEQEKEVVEVQQELSPEEQLEQARRKQASVIAWAIFLDIALLALGFYLLYKHGFSLEWEKLFWTGLMLVCLGGVAPAVLLSVLWPTGGERAFATMRRTQYGYNVLFGCRLLLGLLVVINVIVARYGPPHFDWTSDKVFTLASASVNQAKALDKPVKFIALYPQYSPPGQQLETLFTLYENESDMVSYEFVDRFEDNIKTQEILKEFPGANDPEPVVIVAYGEGENPDHKVIKHNEIFPPATVSDLSFQQVETEFKGEDVFTSAIGQLTQAEKTNVYFTTGHGELALDNSDTRDQQGIGVLKESMGRQNMEVEAINLVQKEIPKDAHVLVIAGPKVPFFPEEVQKLQDYMDGGGHLIAMLDTGPEMRDQANTGLESLLADYNVEVQDNLAVDLVSNFRGIARLLVQIGAAASGHSIIDDLKGNQVILEQAREVKPISSGSPPGGPGTDPPGQYSAETLFTTFPASLLTGGPGSWAEGNYRDESVEPGGPEDSPGPVSLAVAVSKDEGSMPNPHAGVPGAPPPRRKTTPVMVVFGDASFASNPWASQLATNRDLFLNAVNWMRGRTELIGIQPRTRKNIRLTLDNRQYKRMLFGPSLTMLFLFGALGACVWMVRHRY